MKLRLQFTLRGMLLLTAILAVLLGAAIPVLRVWRELQTVEFAVRVTSSGLVRFGSEYPIVAIEPHLRRLAGRVRSQGLTPVLVVEGYSNTPPRLIEEVIAAGNRAGFEQVYRRQLDWPDSANARESGAESSDTRPLTIAGGDTPFLRL